MAVKYVLAIDPGDIHVGWAEFLRLASGQTHFGGGEVHADDAPEFVEQKLLRAPMSAELVIEEFLLYAHKLAAQTWSPMLTSQMIGALKWIARKQGVPVFEQGAFIKKPTRRQMRARGIETVVHGVHARDAELHLYYRILKEGLWSR